MGLPFSGGAWAQGSYLLDICVCRLDTPYMEYIHDNHTVHLIVYHIIWCPRRRRKVLNGPVARRLEQIIHETACEHDWKIIQLAIQPNHVHLFIRTDIRTLCPRISQD
jgi:REP element-mobilizing transposase RayT